MSRAELNDCFDVAVTDRSVTLPDARDFARDGGLHAEAFLGRYLVWESSGSSGEPALFVHDSHSLAVGDALQLLRGPVAGMAGLLAGARIAFVGAIDGPFASIVSLQRQRLLNPWAGLMTRPFSFLQPIAGLVDELNHWQPRVLASYPSMARVLADQQRRGSLRLALRAVWTGGETLTPCCRHAIGQAFACPVWDSYGASECLEIASECAHGAMHLNADWVIL
jgi:phenylacetate-coenzyme A ligase PaaK-like adenylate-forming protein